MIVVALLMGCGGAVVTQAPGTATSTTSTVDPPLTTPTPTGVEAANYAAAGPGTVTVAEFSVDVSSCVLTGTRFVPNAPETQAIVVLAHGFLRTSVNMEGWAEHLASWGVETWAVDLCHASVFDSDHEQNAVDLVELATRQAGDAPILYLGQSAGGLATVLAAAADPLAIGGLGLDPVDAAGLGAAAAATASVPLAALIGDASLCNANNNATSMLAGAADGQLVHVPGADHCTFESPTDGGCTLFCGSGGPEALADTVRGMMTAWVLWRSGADSAGSQWWTPGAGWNARLLSEGRIAVP